MRSSLFSMNCQGLKRSTAMLLTLAAIGLGVGMGSAQAACIDDPLLGVEATGGEACVATGETYYGPVMAFDPGTMLDATAVKQIMLLTSRPGVASSYGAAVMLGDVEIASLGQAPAIMVQEQQATINAQNITISMVQGMGARVIQGHLDVKKNLTILTQNESAIAIHEDFSGRRESASVKVGGELKIQTINAQAAEVYGGILSVSGATTVFLQSSDGRVVEGKYGIAAMDGANISLGSVNISHEGYARAGLYARGGSSISTGKVKILTQISSAGGNLIETSAYSVLANGGTINMAGGQVVVDDSKITGGRLFANSALRGMYGGTINVSGDMEILTDGARSRGVLVSGAGASANFKNVAIETKGSHSPAIQIGNEEAGSVVGNGNVTVSGSLNIRTGNANSPAIYLSGHTGSSRLNVQGDAKSSVNSGSHALMFDGHTAGIKGSQNVVASLQNTTLWSRNANADLIVVGGGTDARSALNLSGGSYAQASKNGWLLNVAGRDIDGTTFALTNTAVASHFNLNLSDKSQMVGSIHTAKGSVLNITMDNSLWYLTGRNDNVSETSSFTTLNLNSGSVVDGSGTIITSTTGAAVNNSAARGNYTLQGTVHNRGGIINLTDDLVGDTLTINGSYSGSQDAYLNMDTQLGDSTSPTDLFRFNGSVAGKTMVQINNANGTGAQTTGDGIRIIEVNGSSPSDAFVLKGNFTTKDGLQAKTAGAYGYTLWHNRKTAPDGDWYLRTEAADGRVLYNPLVPVVEAYPQAILNMMEMDTYRQRRGGYAPGGYTADNTGAENYGQDTAPSLMWARLKAGTGSNLGKESTSGVSQDFDSWTLRSGADGVLYEAGDQSISVGASVIYGQNKTKVTSYNGDGTIDSYAWGIGASATWRGFGGAYVDVQGQTLWHTSTLSSSLVGNIIDENTGLGYSGSIEAGRQIAMGDGFSITPQAQLSYYWVDFQNFRDSENVRVGLRDNTRLVGRLGVSAEKQAVWQGAQGDMRHAQFYGIMNLYYNIVEGTVVNVAGVDFSHEKERAWGGVGVGSSYSWGDDRYSVLGEANVKSAFENMSDNYDVSGTVRMRVKW